MTKGYLEWMPDLRAWNAAVSDHDGEWRLDGGCRWDPRGAAEALVASVERIDEVHVSILGGIDLGTLDAAGVWHLAPEIRDPCVSWDPRGFWSMSWEQGGAKREIDSDADEVIEAACEMRQIIGPEPKEITLWLADHTSERWAGLIASRPFSPHGPHSLLDYQTGEWIRDATAEELGESRAAAAIDGGAGVISVDGRSCWVNE